MKQGVKIHMPVLFKNIDLDDVRQIEFVFKKSRGHGAPSFKNELWTSDGSAGGCVSSAISFQNGFVIAPVIIAVSVFVFAAPRQSEVLQNALRFDIFLD